MVLKDSDFNSFYFKLDILFKVKHKSLNSIYINVIIDHRSAKF